MTQHYYTANYSGFSTVACANRMNRESNNRESSINLSVTFIKIHPKYTELDIKTFGLGSRTPDVCS